MNPAGQERRDASGGKLAGTSQAGPGPCFLDAQCGDPGV